MLGFVNRGRAVLVLTLMGAGVLLGQSPNFITFDTIPDKIFGVSPFPITARASFALPVSFASTTTSVCRNWGGLVMLLSAGTCSIQATQAGNRLEPIRFPWRSPENAEPMAMWCPAAFRGEHVPCATL